MGRSIPILTTALILSGVWPSTRAWPAGNQAFDGTWNVAVMCAKAPDGALPYTWLFSAAVRDGTLSGQYHQPGTSPSGTLSGQIGTDGHALLTMEGLTGKTNYTVGLLPVGSPFRYLVTSQFDADHGTGKRTEMRDCRLDFRKR